MERALKIHTYVRNLLLLNMALLFIHYQNKQKQINQSMNMDSYEDKEKLVLDLENSNSFK